jgi:hypothetical protein
MAQVKVRVTNAVVGGHRHGEEILVDESHAKMLLDRGYVEKVEDADESFTTVEAAEEKAEEDKPKRRTTKKKTEEDK